jgi:DNA-binding response OmpR family regulator
VTAVGTVLVVDDHERMSRLLSRMLGAEGHSVLTAADGTEALDRLAHESVDLVLLDLVMPRRGGLQVLAELRGRGDTTPVIVLSAVPDVASRVRALDGGAVDFVGKPFERAELAARVRRSLAARSSHRDARDCRIERGGVRLDAETRTATHAGESVVLSARESAVLAHLMRGHGRVCSRKEMLRAIWGVDFDPGTNVVDVCVRRIRRKLPGVPIRTIRAAGYCFEGAGS